MMMLRRLLRLSPDAIVPRSRLEAFVDEARAALGLESMDAGDMSVAALSHQASHYIRIAEAARQSMGMSNIGDDVMTTTLATLRRLADRRRMETLYNDTMAAVKATNNQDK